MRRDSTHWLKGTGKQAEIQDTKDGNANKEPGRWVLGPGLECVLDKINHEADPVRSPC